MQRMRRGREEDIRINVYMAWRYWWADDYYGRLRPLLGVWNRRTTVAVVEGGQMSGKTEYNWFESYEMRQIHPRFMKPEDVDILDIAHSLSLICRFNGHCNWHYSVAQHSLVVSKNLPEHLQFQGLMHDATEAYCGDMVRPLKVDLPAYQKIEQDIWIAICQRYGLPEELDPLIKIADDRALMTERRDVRRQSGHAWAIKELPYKERITRISNEEAESKFLVAFEYLTG